MAPIPDDLIIYTGSAGTGQKIQSPSATVVEGWLLDVPGWSAAWHHFMVCVVHLRPEEGFPVARKFFPQATHELAVFALDSEKLPLPNDHTTWIDLQPWNCVCQFTADSDLQAAHACRALALEALEGRLFLETQGIIGAKELWAERLKSLLSPGARIE